MRKKFDTEKRDSKINLLDELVSPKMQSEFESIVSARKAILWMDNVPVCTKILDLNFNLQYMSPAGIKALNIDDITSFYGQPYPFDFFPKSFSVRMTNNLNKAVKTNKIIIQEASEANVVDIKGKKLWFHSTIIPVAGDDGRIESLLVISLDSTEHKQAELELSKYRELQKVMGVKFLTDYSNPPPNNSSNRSFMRKIENCVIANISDCKFDVNALAKQLFMSRSTLQRKLTKKTGVGAAQFIRQARLDKAHEFIQRDAHRTIAETAHAVGFKHPGHFSKLYKKYVSKIKEGDTSPFNNRSFKNLNHNVNDLYTNILSTGLEALSLTLGVVSHIENDLYKIVAVISENDVFVPGEVFRLHDTYCREVIEDCKTLALTKLNGKSGLCAHPLYTKIPLEAYIGTPIYKNGNVWGTLNFSSQKIKDHAFKDEEIAMIEKLARQLSCNL